MSTCGSGAAKTEPSTKSKTTFPAAPPIGTADLRSPQEAYTALCNGKFYGEYLLSGEVRVTDCKLEEMQDTKRIVQYVYRFHLVTKSQEFDILIPAIQAFHR